MLLNKTMLDWLTLTTFDSIYADGLWKLFDDMTVDQLRESERRLQYKGKAQDGVFWGSGTQSGKEHFMFQASGERAHHAGEKAPRVRDVKCTRIDLQITIHKPRGYSTREVFDLLKEPGAAWTGRPKALNMVQSGDECDTLYVGSRSSDLLMRLYIKPDENGAPSFLRFECEYKREKANSVWRDVAGDFRNIGGFLAYELTRLPRLPFGVSSTLLHVANADPHAPTTNRVESDSDTIRWLERQVEPAVLRLLHSHEHGDTMERILRRWLRNVEQPGGADNERPL